MKSAQRADDLTRRSPTAGNGTIHSAGAALGVGCLAGKEQGATQGPGEGCGSLCAADGGIAVGATREWVVLPVLCPERLDQVGKSGSFECRKLSVSS